MLRRNSSELMQCGLKLSNYANATNRQHTTAIRQICLA
jgi:hypothetical protein